MNIAERDTITDVSLGKQVRVLYNENGDSQSYTWNGTSWEDSLLDFVDFDITEQLIPQEGRIGWDTDNQTLSVGLANGVVLQVGQEQYIRAKNVSGETIYNGEAVYIYGASGNRAEVKKAIASNDSATKTIAICTQDSVADNNNGFFTTVGIVNDVNTSAMGTNVQDGQPLYLSDTAIGKITNVKPSKPNYCVCVGYVIRTSTTVGQILVKIDASPKIGELSNVDTTEISDGDSLYYEEDTDTFKRIESGFNHKALWEDIMLYPESLGTGSSAPDLVSINGSKLRSYGFDGGNLTEQLYGSFEIPHTYNVGSTLRPHIHWSTTTTGTGNVKWQLEYEIKDVGEIFTGVTSTIVAVDSTDGVAYKNHVVEFNTINIPTLKIGAQCKFRLFRNPSDAEDTYGSDVILLTLGIHFEVISNGSRTVMAK